MRSKNITALAVALALLTGTLTLAQAAKSRMALSGSHPLRFQVSPRAARVEIAIEPRTGERALAASFRPVP
jgi:hypothetical protein